MSKLRRLIEAANEPCTMGWKVYSYNPLEDNKLMDTSKAFDDIAMAQQHKRKILEKNPCYIVEIVAESAQKNEAAFKPNDKVSVKSYDKFGNQFVTLKDAIIIKEISEKEAGQLEPAYNWKEPTGQKYYLVKLSTGSKKVIPVKDINLESSQKNEAANIDDKLLEYNYKKTDFKSTADFDRIESKIRKDLNVEKNDAYKNRIRHDLHIIYGWDQEFHKNESSQKNEVTNIDVKNPGILEVPADKNVEDLPQSHFEKLVDKKGYAEVIRALTNLEVWNKDKNKSLSSWASDMADKLKKKFRPESSQKNEAFRVEVKPTYLSKVDTKGMTKTFNTEKEAIAYHSKLEKTDAYQKGKISVELWITNESSQKNESLRDLNLDLANDTNAIIASADKIRQRFEYRTLQNQSYDEKQAEKIYLEIRRELEKAKKLIDACYNKIG